MSRWIRKTGTCDICLEVKELGKSTPCPECRRVQQDISFLHTKYRGCREDRPEVLEQLIAAHAARVEQHLAGVES